MKSWCPGMKNMSSVVNYCEGGNEELLEGVKISCKQLVSDI